MSNARFTQIQTWLETVLPSANLQLHPLAGDASFRRYFRVQDESISYVLMDAPPEQEPIMPFITIAEQLRNHGIQAPAIHAHNSPLGFILLSDFGDQCLHGVLNNGATPWYHKAMDIIGQCQTLESDALPQFDADFMRMECQRFIDWYCKTLLDLQLSACESTMLEKTLQTLIATISGQPTTWVYRDFHSRNLMVLPAGDIGVLDFQDAMQGPITYDLVSLLRDCYIDWPEQDVTAWAQQFYQQHDFSLSEQEFLRAFDEMSLQRHLKCAGIFARLRVRDKKDLYLQYIPRILNYLMTVARRYPEYQDLADFIETRAMMTTEVRA